MYRFSRRGFLLASAGTLLAQDSGFTTGVDVVTLLATVRDSDGRVVQDLTRDDSYTFLDQVLRPDEDQAFVAHFDARVEVVQGFTSSRQELRAALDQLEVPVEVATLLYEAVRQTSETMMRPRQGRKAFILLSGGVSFRDKTSIGTAIESAQRAGTIIYSILFAGRGKGAMQRLARETGGSYLEISGGHTIEDAYARIEDALRNQYSLGYTPARSDKSAGYRKIKLTVNRPGLMVQTREGYYAN